MSEFGKGTAYCLGLFLAHADRYRFDKECAMRIPGYSTEHLAEMWFSGSSDHLYELVIPKNYPPVLKKRLEEFKGKCLAWGHDFGIGSSMMATEKDVTWAIQEAKSLLRVIDEFHGISTEKGDWE
jgi:hypothetical protein